MGHWTPTGIEPTDYDDDLFWRIIREFSLESAICSGETNMAIETQEIIEVCTGLQCFRS